MSALAWSDLFSEASDVDLQRVLSLWPASVHGMLRPIGMSAFGDVYFERPDGAIERLDVLEGGVGRVAPSFFAFRQQMSSSAWQEANLLSEGVALLRERGLSRAAGECFAFVPHPTLTGKLDFGHTMVMSALAWHAVCSQLLDCTPSTEATGT